MTLPVQSDDTSKPSTTTSGEFSSADTEFYLFDKKSQTFVKLKPDYSNRIPLASAHTKGASTRELKGAKADKQLGVIVPLTKRRPNSSDYNQLAIVARKYPRIDTIAVINPTLDRRGVGLDGPSADPEYTNAIRFLQANGVSVIGYIATGGAVTKTFEECKKEIDRWKEWYPDIQGVFFDEMNPSLEKLDYYKKLDEHAKKSREMKITVGDMANRRAVGDAISGGDGYFHNTDINVFVVYENRGFPAENWYAAYKKDWTQNYPRSRFAWLAFGVPDNNALACNNFIDKVVGIEGLAGYVYVQPELGVPDDMRGFAEWDTLSPYLETILIALDRQAAQERLPFTKGVFPDQVKLSTEPTLRTIAQRPVEEAGDVARGDKDVLGISKVYPSVSGGFAFEWQSEHLPEEERKIFDSKHVITITAKGQSKLVDQEITGYFKFKEPLADELLKIHTRTAQKDLTGKNKVKQSCDISGYIGILSSDGSVHVKKQIDSEAMTSKRAGTQMTNEPLENRWIGVKFIVFNYQAFDPQKKNEITVVRLEFYVDDNVTDQSKELVVRNDWRKIMVTSDEGGWMAQNVKVPKTAKDGTRIIDKCPSLNINKEEGTMGREIDELITLPGGTEDSNCVMIELPEGTQFRYISARAIHAPDRD